MDETKPTTVHYRYGGEAMTDPFDSPHCALGGLEYQFREYKRAARALAEASDDYDRAKARVELAVQGVEMTSAFERLVRAMRGRR